MCGRLRKSRAYCPERTNRRIKPARYESVPIPSPPRVMKESEIKAKRVGWNFKYATQA